MVVYLSVMRPFTKTINLMQTLLIEIIVLVLSICVLILTLLEVNGTGTTETKLMLGDVVILGNDIVNILIICFFFVRCWQEGSAIVRAQRAKATEQKDRTALIQVLGLVVQQSNMGFEEVINDSASLSPFTTPSTNKKANIKRTLMPSLPPAVTMPEETGNINVYSFAKSPVNPTGTEMQMNLKISQFRVSEVSDHSSIRDDSPMANNRLKSRILRHLSPQVTEGSSVGVNSPNMGELRENSLLLSSPTLSNVKRLTRLARDKKL